MTAFAEKPPFVIDIPLTANYAGLKLSFARGYTNPVSTAFFVDIPRDNGYGF